MKQKEKKEIGYKIAKVYMTLVIAFSFFAANGYYSYAKDYGEKIGTWFLDQLFWFGIVALAIGLFTCLLKKAWVTMLVTAIIGGIALVFIKEPNFLVDIGESIYHAIFDATS